MNLRTRRVVGMEALVRWRHPHLGELPPESFLDVVEKFTLATDLGDRVLRTACTACTALGEWQRDGSADGAVLRLHVSPRQLVDPGFADGVAETLASRRHGERSTGRSSAKSPRTGTIVAAVTAMAAAFEIDVIAEGVETEDAAATPSSSDAPTPRASRSPGRWTGPGCARSSRRSAASDPPALRGGVSVH